MSFSLKKTFLKSLRKDSSKPKIVGSILKVPPEVASDVSDGSSVFPKDVDPYLLKKRGMEKISKQSEVEKIFTKSEIEKNFTVKSKMGIGEESEFGNKAHKELDDNQRDIQTFHDSDIQRNIPTDSDSSLDRTPENSISSSNSSLNFKNSLVTPPNSPDDSPKSIKSSPKSLVDSPKNTDSLSDSTKGTDELSKADSSISAIASGSRESQGSENSGVDAKKETDHPVLTVIPKDLDIERSGVRLGENEQRSMIAKKSFEDPKLIELMSILINWVNDELAEHRIIVKSLEEDLYDGQVLQKLYEKLTGGKLDVPEVTQSEEGQRQKLGVVLSAVNRMLGGGRWADAKWSVESVHSKNLASILHLLVALVKHFRPPVRLPENVSVDMVIVQKKEGTLVHRAVREEITGQFDECGMRCERDAFDTLFDHAPDKLMVVKKSLITFVNKHLSKVNLEVSEVENQFHDGVYLTLLMGLLEGFFVPLHAFHLTPRDFDQKVHNVSFAFQLMQDVGLAKPKARPEDIVNLDLKSTLRVLYNLFVKYKNLC